MDNRAIAIFDSGLGGLTALRALRRLMPGENLIFFGDSAHAPYGGRSREELIRLSLRDLAFVTGFDVKAVLVACGTSSSNAMEQLKAASPVPVVGVIDSAAKKAVMRAQDGGIGVIATEATINSGAYQRAIEAIAPKSKVLACACPEFVPLVESGRFGRNDPETAEEVRRALEPFLGQECRVMLLGCTHYPMLAPEISAVLPGAELVSNSEAAAQELAGFLNRTGALADRQSGEVRIYTSGDADLFRENARLFLRDEYCGTVSHADI